MEIDEDKGDMSEVTKVSKVIDHICACLNPTGL